MPLTASIPDRRYDLDWIRVGAFFLLILYHVGMFYVPWDWHVKSPHPVDELELAMFLTNPWRLTLLFLVSGAATRFMADNVTVGKLTGARIVASRLGEQAIERGLATKEALAAIAAGWEEWRAADDGWFAVLHAEILCTP